MSKIDESIGELSGKLAESESINFMEIYSTNMIFLEAHSELLKDLLLKVFKDRNEIAKEVTELHKEQGLANLIDFYL